MIIDSHHHLWTLSRGDYGWMSPALAPIYRDFAPADMEPHLKAAGIDKTIIVQAADTIAETEFMLATAAQTPCIAGVVGWVDMESDTAISDLERLSTFPLLKGIRPMIQEIKDDDWILRPSLDPAFDALVEMGLRFDALVLPRHLPRLLKRLDRHPGLPCVINHGAKPHLSTGDLETWRMDIVRIAANTGSYCKLSGLVTEAGENYTIETIRPAADHILEAFGPERVMFGSDWPVLNLAGTYSEWFNMSEKLTAHLAPQQIASVFGGAAAAFYGIRCSVPASGGSDLG